MIKKTIRQMLAAQVLSALTVSLCLLIDNMMIGNFIGVGGLSAYGLASPLLILVGAVATMLSAGVQVVCSASLANGDTAETNRGYSSAVGLAAVVSVTVMVLVLLLRDPIASLLGAPGQTDLHADTSSYLLGFVTGALPTMGALVLVPFLQMAGQSRLLIAAVLAMTVADVGLDYLFSVVLGWGMLGMGLASSVSYYVAFIIGGRYFISKKCVFKFAFGNVSIRKMGRLLKAGIPTVVNMATSVAFTFVMNRLLLHHGGSLAVAAYSVVNTLGGAANCISSGAGGVALTLSSMFYHEEDRTGLRQMLSSMIRYSLVMGVAMTVFIYLATPGLVGLFLPEAGDSRTMAELGMRLYAIGLTFCCVNNAVRGTWQGCDQVLRTELTSVLEGFLFPTSAAFVLSAFSASYIWLFFLVGELLTLVLIWVYVSRRKKSLVPRADTFLMLPADFGVTPDNLIEVNVTCLEDVMKASAAASDFCLSHGQTQLIANRVGLCIEEMGTNTVNYGFSDGRKHHMNIRVQYKGSRWTLRFRDDCHAFDPMSRIPSGEGTDNLGIRVLMGMSKDIRYTYSLNLNNLTIVIE